MIEALVIAAVLLNLYAMGLVFARAWIFRQRLYRPMLWNIWLSVAPILVLGATVVTGFLLMRLSPVLGWVAFVAGGIAWLLLLPNASYLITELNLSHRKENDVVPLWYDIILVISLAMSGVLNTVMNVFLAHLLYALSRYGDAATSLLKADVLVVVALVLVMLAFGMYLGRYLRLNSWDIRSPKRLFTKMCGHFREPGNLSSGLGFTVTYAVFLAVMYVALAGTAVVGLGLIEATRASLQ